MRHVSGAEFPRQGCDQALRLELTQGPHHVRLRKQFVRTIGWRDQLALFEPTQTRCEGASQLGANARDVRIGPPLGEHGLIDPGWAFVGCLSVELHRRQRLKFRCCGGLARHRLAAQRHESAACRHVARPETTQLRVVHPSVDGIDDHAGAIGDLIHHAHSHHLADQRRLARSTHEQGHSRGTAIDPGFGQRPLHHPGLTMPCSRHRTCQRRRDQPCTLAIIVPAGCAGYRPEPLD